MSSFTYLDKFTNNYPRTQLSLANTYGIRTPTTVYRWKMADGVSHVLDLKLYRKLGPMNIIQILFVKMCPKCHFMKS